ncbi:MAG: CHAT domain-containing protein [Maribacter sp.]
MKRTFVLLLIVSPFYLFPQGNEDKEELMYDYFDKGFEQMYINVESAYSKLELALEVAIEIGDYDSQLGILDHMAMSSSYHYDLKKYRETLDKIELRLKNKDIASKIQDYEGWQISFESNTGGYYFKTKEYTKAKSIFLNIRSRFDSIRSEDLVASQADYLSSTYSYLGTIYKHLGKYDLSEQYYLRNIALIKANPVLAEEARSLIIGEQRLLAQLYALTGRFNEANNYYNKSLEWGKENYSKDKIYKNHLLSTFQKATQNYIEQDSLKKALLFLDESQGYLIENDPFRKEALVLYGDVYSGLNEDKKALENYENALRAFAEYRQQKPHRDIAEVHGKIAELHLKQKGYQKGLQTIQKAFNVAGSNIQINDVNQNPKPEQVFSKTQLLQLLDIKLQLLRGSYEDSEEAAYHVAILQTSHDLLETFDLLKSEFDSRLDKQFLAEKAYPVFHRLLETAHKAYEKDPSSETLQLALNISEKNKGFVLLEALRNAQATQYGDVPTNILEKEAQLRAEITNLEKQLFDASEIGNSYSDALFKRKHEYFGFLDILKTKYPKYHELKYQNRTLNLATIRKQLLDDNGTLISYTMANNYLYAIVINGSNEDFLKLPFNETAREAIRTFYRTLSSPSIKGGEKKIYDLANSLFEKILQEPLENIDSENLTIIPDGELHYLPFDLLQENESYLLETKNIGYGNSVTSLLELEEKPRAETNNLLAFAPSFSGPVTENLDRQFGKLLYNDDEVQKIGTFFDSETLLTESATLHNFKSNASRFNILHLATHASANDEYPDYSYLAFTNTKDRTQSNILYIKDLYNMALPADMVTLSACQTGIGKLQKGQGMMSLSKGFYYAGAKSLVNTLWKINDKSTVKLMEYFYEGLSQGKSKTEALRSAKLRYLKSTDDELLKHPYYWAAFVVSGDVSPITNNNTIWWIVGLGGFALLLGGFFLQKRK